MIKCNLQKLSIKKLEETKNFIDFLIEKDKKNNKIIQMRGIWSGIGFEKIDLDDEIRNIRNDSEKLLSERSMELSI
jgi:hypothetical protein